LKIYRPSTGVEYTDLTIEYSAGTGTYGDLLMAVSQITLTEVPGCMDETACNYNPDATVDDGSCYYETEYWSDVDGDGYGYGDTGMYCAGDEPDGWILYDGIADNCPDTYNPDQTDGDGNGVGFACQEGCTDDAALNYDFDAGIDDGSCYFVSIPANLVAVGGLNQIELSWDASSRAEVELSITDISDTNIELYMVNSVDVYGFQFNILADEALAAAFGSASGGTAAENGFAVSTNADGLVLGFSFTGGFIPAGEGVLTNVAWTPGGSDAFLDLSIDNFSGAGGLAVSTEVVNSPYCYGNCGTMTITYNVYRDDILIASGLEETAYTDTGLGDGEYHCYNVTAYDEVAETPFSNTACATTMIVVYGCMDINACNYDPNATEDDGSCTYPEDYWSDYDFDGVGYGDINAYCPADVPVDWILYDGVEPDNCPDDYNPDQADSDGNGIGDVCDEVQETNFWGSGTINTDPDSIFFNFGQQMNGSSPADMDIEISGNEGANFGAEGYFAAPIDPPSMLYYLSPDSSLSSITEVPTVDDTTTTWTTISWDWNGGNGGMPVAPGNIWVVYTTTTHKYAVMEITDVASDWSYPAISFDYVYLGEGGTEIPGGDIYGCMDPTACNYNPDATIDDGSCTYPEDYWSDYDFDGVGYGDINAYCPADVPVDWIIYDGVNPDNCPDTYNPDQLDSNGNGIGDACEPTVNPPENLMAQGGDQEITLTWDAPSTDVRADILLWISDMTDTNIEISMTNSADVYGFQFNIIPDEALAGVFSSAYGGTAEDNGFSVSTNESGLVLGFSFSAGFIPAGTGVLTNVAWTPNGIDAYTDLAVTNFAGFEGVVLSVETGEQYCYGTCGIQEMTYNVYRDGAILAQDISETTYTDSGLGYGESHCYTVTTVLDGEESLASNEACAATDELLGCTNADACNYNPEATEDDGSCVYTQDYWYDADADTYGAGETAQYCAGDEPDGWILYDGMVDNCPDTPNEDQADGDSNGIGDVCQEGCTDPDAVNFDMYAGLSCGGDNSCCTYATAPQDLMAEGGDQAITLSWQPPTEPLRSDVSLWISNATETSIEISMISITDVYGFQFDIIADDVLGAVFGDASGGMAGDAGFMMSTNAGGLVLGFSLTGGFIPAGEGVLTNVSWTPSGTDGNLDLQITNFAGLGGIALSYETGAPFCYACGTQELTYTVYRDGSEIANGLSETSYTDSGLGYLEYHCYQVTAVYNGSAESGPSNEACATTWPSGPIVFGCMDSDAVNYNPDATVEDGSCVFFGTPNYPPDGQQFWFNDGNTYGDNGAPIDSITFDWSGSIDPGIEVCGWSLNIATNQNEMTIIIPDLAPEVTSYTMSYLDLAEGLFLYDDNITDFDLFWWVDICLESEYYPSDQFNIIIDTWALGVDNPAIVPDEFTLGQNYPNPFNPATRIEFGVPEIAHVTLNIYDLSGRLVKNLVDSELGAGTHSSVWDGTDMNNNLVPTGVYVYILNTEKATLSRKMVMMK